MTKKLTIAMSAIYLLIEMQAWAFLSEIYRKEVPSSLLSDYELFGYASAGIGLSLLALKFSLRSKNKAIIIIGALLTPIVYVSAVWGMYELVNNSDKLIPNSKRPQVLSASIKTLGGSSWTNSYAFLLDNQSDENIENQINNFQRLHPTPDRVIQYTYIHGINNLYLFNNRYKEAAEMVDKELWPILWKKTRSAAMYKTGGELHLRAAESYLTNLKIWVDSSKNNPMEWLSLYGGMLYIEQENKAPFESFPLIGQSKVKKNYEYQNEEINKVAWELMGESFKLWPKMEAFNEESFREAMTIATVGAVVNINQTLIPWYQGDQSVFLTQEYNLFVRQLTPFFFAKDGSPLISMKNISDRSTRTKYIERLQDGLPERLRESWFEFQRNSLTLLSNSKSEWENKTASKIASPLLRVGVITPIMLVLSSTLVVFNIIMLWRDSKLVAITIVLLGICIGVGLFPSASNFALETLIKISVEKPAIYLRV